MKLDVTKLEKVELHRHLELCLRESTIRELAPKFGIEIPNDQAFRDRFIIDEPMTNLGSVLNKFLDTQLLLASEEILERITYEACEDAFNEGIRLLELRYAPTYVIYRHDNLSFEKIHSAIVRGMNRAKKDFGMKIGLICIIQRILSVEVAEKVVRFAIDNRDTFIGLDLADNEEGFDSKPFSPFFKRAREAGLGITIHAGEPNLKNAPRYVREAVEILGAQRIGHGIQIYRDPEMIKFVVERGIPLEVCVKSNYLTQAIPGEIKYHPIRKLMDAGVQVCINTDDPGIFATDLNQEYEILRDVFDFTENDFKRCNEVARKHSFIRN